MVSRQPGRRESALNTLASTVNVGSSKQLETIREYQRPIADVPALNTVSMNIYDLYSPGFPGLPSLSAYGAKQQIGHAGISPLGSGVAPGSQPVGYSTDGCQFGSDRVRGLIRVLWAANSMNAKHAGAVA